MLRILNSKIVKFIYGLSIILIIVLSSINYHSFNRKFYQSTYQELNTHETIGISQVELSNSTEVLLDYLQDYRSDLAIDVVQRGQEKPMFNQLEIDHMVDVKNLYQTAMSLRIISILVFLILTSLYLMFMKSDWQYTFYKGYQHALLGFGVILFCIVSYVIVDFEGFWILFHQVLFTNELWLLNPLTDNLILMVPQQFFNQLVINIIVTIIFSLLLLYSVLWYLTKPKKMGQLNIVLFEPEIPQNVGNILRTSMATNSILHIIEPIGFIWDDKRLRRSGMDYIDQTKIIFHDDLNAFYKQVDGECFYVTRYGKKPHTALNYTQRNKNIYLIFGKESTGLPLDLLNKNSDYCMRLPMNPEARSLNLSNCVAICAYEVLRQQNYPNLSLVEVQKGENWLSENNQTDL